MKHKTIYLILASFSLLGAVFDAGARERADSQKLQKIFNSPGNVANTVAFLRAQDGKVLFSYNPSRVLMPASVTKLVTSAVLLDKFGPDKTFITRFYHTGTLINGNISGDLIVVGDGDPFLVSEKLWQAVSDLHHLGVRRIKGNIIVDQSLFRSAELDRSRESGKYQSEHAYDAPVSAFAVNFNTIALAIAPVHRLSSKSVQRPLVAIDPYPIDGVSIINRARSVSGNSHSIKVTRVTQANSKMKLVVEGVTSGGRSLEKVYRSLGPKTEIAGEYLRSFLEARGIVVNGGVKTGRKNMSAKLLYELPSYPLAKMILGLNKYSNNFIADVLTKRLGAEFPSIGRANAVGSGTYENGRFAIEKYLKEQIELKSMFVFNNGSGLSTKNRFSANGLSGLLVHIYRKMSVFPEFLSSLPASGVDGTLKDRFKKSKFRGLIGNVRAKTGTLTEPVSASSLAGYVRHPVHGMVAFAIIQNGITGKKQPSIGALRDSQEESLLFFLNYFKN